MLRQAVLPTHRFATIALLLLLASCLNASAQKVKITIKCEPPEAPKVKIATPDKTAKSDSAKTPKFELKRATPTDKQGPSSATESQAGVITKGCVALAQVTAGPSASHANQIVLFNIVQSNQILKMRLNSQGTFANSLQVFIPLDANGFGLSPQFQVLGEQLGTTTLLAESPGFDDAPLDIIVVECNCPIIPVSSPPRP